MHVGHGHVDLRLFLARRDQHGKQAQQQRHQRQQRRDLRALEKAAMRPGHAQVAGGWLRIRCPFAGVSGRPAGPPGGLRVGAFDRIRPDSTSTCRPAPAQAHLAQLRLAGGVQHVHRRSSRRGAPRGSGTNSAAGAPPRWAAGGHRQPQPGEHARRQAVSPAGRSARICTVWVAASTVGSTCTRGGQRAGGQAQCHRLRHGGRHAQRAGSYTVTSGRPGMAMSPSCHRHLGHHAGKRRAHHVEAGLGARRAGLGQLRIHLRLGGLELGLGLLQRGLADVVLLEQLALAVQSWRPRPARRGRPAPGPRWRRRSARPRGRRCAAAPGRRAPGRRPSRPAAPPRRAPGRPPPSGAPPPPRRRRRWRCWRCRRALPPWPAWLRQRAAKPRQPRPGPCPERWNEDEVCA
jgi:hypothetical protein